MGASPRFGFTTPPEMATVPRGLVSFEKPHREYENVLAQSAIRRSETAWCDGLADDHYSRPKVKLTKAQRHLAYQRARRSGKSRRAAAELAGYHCCSDASYETKGSALDKILGIARPSDLKKRVVRP